MKSIVLTGGGTAGHVTPNIALLPALTKEGYAISYIGSKNGIERELIESKNIKYYPISSGKLRRYIDVKNLTDIFRVVKGLADALSALRKIRPTVVFSKGGFVSVPVVMAAKMLKIPVVIHESDITPGLANKLSVPNAAAVCASFENALAHIPAEKAYLTGTPIRSELFSGNSKEGLKLCGFDGSKPIVLVMGGSLGSVKINNNIRKNLGEITKYFDVVHLCGKGNLSQEHESVKGYRQFEYLSGELTHILAMCDIVVSRSGSNSIFEFLALKKPMLLIPLSKNASRGDQILNAEDFAKHKFALVLQEEDITDKSLIAHIRLLYENRRKYIDAMENTDMNNGVENVMRVIRDTVQKYGK